MEEWVHCNLCCRQLSGDVKFYLGTCSHIFCELCKNKGADSCCAVCRNPCKMTELNGELDHHLKPYFMVPESQIKKQVEVMKFQAYHRSILLKHMRRVVEGQRRAMKQAEEHFHKLKQENGDLRKKVQNLEDANNQLRHDNSLLKKYIHSYEAFESDSLLQKPVTPRQLVHSPNIVSPLVRYSNKQSPLERTSSRAVASPTTPMIISHRSSAAPACLEEIQNTPHINRISVRMPPSKGRMGTPTQQSLKPAYPNQISSPVVGVDASPGHLSKFRSNSVANSPLQLRSPQFISRRTRSPMLSEAPQQNAVRHIMSNTQSGLKRNFQSLHDVYNSPFNGVSDPIRSIKTSRPNVSSKYFVRVNPTPPCTPTIKMIPSPR